MQPSWTFLVLGATGGTGKHFVTRTQKDGHKVRALVRNPAKLPMASSNLEVHEGSITDVTNLDALVKGVDFVVFMLGDRQLQQINLAFVKQLVPAMRR